MRYSNLTPFLAGACLSIAALTSALAQTAESAKPASNRPTGTRPLSATVAENTLQVFRHKDFGGDMIQVSDVIGKQSWTDNDFVAAKMNNFDPIKTQQGISAGVNYAVGEHLVLALEYFHADHTWYFNDKQRLNVVNTGLTVLW